MLKFDYNKVIFDTEIGVGTFGTVHPYQKDKQDKRFVVKHMYAKDIIALLNMVQEIVIGFSCDHPSLVPVTGYFIEPLKPKGFNVFIKMPRMKENLGDYIKAQRKNNVNKVPEETIVKHLHDMLSGLEYLEKKKIAHRDIKPTNMLLDNEGNLKLTDIGSAAFIDEEDKVNLVSQQVGTFFYMAPEVLANFRSLKREDLYSADIWSMGLVIAELCLLQTQLVNPHEYPKEPIVQDILNKIKAKYSKKLVDVLTEMLHVNPNSRNKDARQLREMLETSFSNIFGQVKSEKAQPPPQTQKKVSAKPVPKAKEKVIEDLGNSSKSVGSTGAYSTDVSAVFEETKIEEKIVKGKKQEKKPVEKKASEKEAPQIISSKSQIISPSIASPSLTGSKFFQNLPQETQVDSKEANWEKTIKGLQEYTKSTSYRIKSATLFNFDLLFQPSWGEKYNLSLLKMLTDNLIPEPKLHNIDYLKRFKLSFNEFSQVADEQLKSLALSINQNIKVNDTFHLDFNQCTKITDQGIKHLTKAFSQNCQKVRYLTLKFRDESLSILGSFFMPEPLKITDLGAKVLFMQIRELKDVRILTIHLNYCSKITDNIFKEITPLINGKHKDLSNIEINLDGCSKLTDHGIETFFAHISHSMGFFSKMIFSFSYTGLTDKTKENLKKAYPKVIIS